LLAKYGVAYLFSLLPLFEKFGSKLLAPKQLRGNFQQNVLQVPVVGLEPLSRCLAWSGEGVSLRHLIQSEHTPTRQRLRRLACCLESADCQMAILGDTEGVSLGNTKLIVILKCEQPVHTKSVIDFPRRSEGLLIGSKNGVNNISGLHGYISPFALDVLPQSQSHATRGFRDASFW
jgi:hypothetical protein